LQGRWDTSCGGYVLRGTGVNPTTASRRNVKKTCRWHVFSSDHSGYAARREPRGTGARFFAALRMTGRELRPAGGRAEQSPAPTGLMWVRVRVCGEERRGDPCGRPQGRWTGDEGEILRCAQNDRDAGRRIVAPYGVDGDAGGVIWGKRISLNLQATAQGPMRAVQGHSDMVPVAGLEPARCFHQRILSPLRLPITPYRRAGIMLTPENLPVKNRVAPLAL
jgi:hypothetical protein